MIIILKNKRGKIIKLLTVLIPLKVNFVDSLWNKELTIINCII